HRAPGLVVMCDDLVLDKSLWGVTIPVDPGDHRLSVSAPNKRAFTWIVTVPKGAGVLVTTTVPALRDLPEHAPPAREAKAEGGLRAQEVVGLSVVGLGLAGVVVGSVLGVRAISRYKDTTPHCQDDFCDPFGVALRSEARRTGTASTAVFFAAGTAVAAGVALYFMTPKQHAIRAAATLGVTRSGSYFSLEALW